MLPMVHGSPSLEYDTPIIRRNICGRVETCSTRRKEYTGPVLPNDLSLFPQVHLPAVDYRSTYRLSKQAGADSIGTLRRHTLQSGLIGVILPIPGWVTETTRPTLPRSISYYELGVKDAKEVQLSLIAATVTCSTISTICTLNSQTKHNHRSFLDTRARGRVRIIQIRYPPRVALEAARQLSEPGWAAGTVGYSDLPSGRQQSRPTTDPYQEGHQGIDLDRVARTLNPIVGVGNRAEHPGDSCITDLPTNRPFPRTVGLRDILASPPT